MTIPGKSKSEIEPPPPVTYIGDPSDGLTEYKRRTADSTQQVIDPVTAGNEIVEVRYSGSDPSVVASGYLVLPVGLVRRKSSLRREKIKVRTHCFILYSFLTRVNITHSIRCKTVKIAVRVGVVRMFTQCTTKTV